MSQVARKGPALLILLGVAAAFIGLGIFLDNEVLLPPSNPDEIVHSAANQAGRDAYARHPENTGQPSEVEQQLQRAVEAANNTETDKTKALDKKIAESKALIEQNNRMLEEKGVSGAVPEKSKKAQEFNQKLNELKARLVELQSSK